MHFHEVVSELRSRGQHKLAVDLIIARMSTHDAVDLLDLPQGWTKEDLKRAYRDKALEYHPDHPGGDTEKMKLVNEAYKMLKGREGIRKTGHDWWEESKRKNEEIAKRLPNLINEIYDPRMFEKYFSELVGQKFDTFVEDRKGTYSWTRQTEWRAEDGETVFTLVLSVDYSSVERRRMLGGDEDTLAFSVNMYRTVFHDNRKSKLKQRDFEVATTRMALTPSQLFPKTALKRVLKGKDKERKFSKRDMLLGMERKLKAKVDHRGNEVWVFIPFGDDLTLTLVRMTLMRMPSWQVNGVYYKYKRVAQPRRYAMAPETEEVLNELAKLQKKKLTDPQKIADAASDICKKAMDKMK